MWSLIFRSITTGNGLSIAASSVAQLTVAQKSWIHCMPVSSQQDAKKMAGRLARGGHGQVIGVRGLGGEEEHMEIIADASIARAGGIIKFQINRQKYVWHYSVDWLEIGYSRNPRQLKTHDMEMANALLATLIARKPLHMMRLEGATKVTIKMDNDVLWQRHILWIEIEDMLGCVPIKQKELKESSVDMSYADALSRKSWRKWQAEQRLQKTHYRDRQDVEKNDEAQTQLSELERRLRRRGKHPADPSS